MRTGAAGSEYLQGSQSVNVILVVRAAGFQRLPDPPAGPRIFIKHQHREAPRASLDCSGDAGGPGTHDDQV